MGWVTYQRGEDECPGNDPDYEAGPESLRAPLGVLVPDGVEGVLAVLRVGATALGVVGNRVGRS